MKELKLIVSRLEEQVELLIQRNQELLGEIEALKSDKERLINIKSECELEIDSLKARNEALYIAKSLSMQKGGEKMAQKTVEKILREIDDCIALINQ